MFELSFVALTAEEQFERMTATSREERLRCESIAFNNSNKMTANAFREVYGAGFVSEIFDVIRMLVHSTARDRKLWAASENLKSMLCDDSGFKKQTALRNILSALGERSKSSNGERLKVISQRRSGSFSQLFFEEGEEENRKTRLAGFLAVIPKVVSIQLDNPFDERAGSELLPPSIYYNAVSEFQKKASLRDPNWDGR